MQCRTLDSKVLLSLRGDQHSILFAVIPSAAPMPQGKKQKPQSSLALPDALLKVQEPQLQLVLQGKPYVMWKQSFL